MAAAAVVRRIVRTADSIVWPESGVSSAVGLPLLIMIISFSRGSSFRIFLDDDFKSLTVINRTAEFSLAFNYTR